MITAQRMYTKVTFSVEVTQETLNRMKKLYDELNVDVDWHLQFVDIDAEEETIHAKTGVMLDILDLLREFTQ